MKNSNINMRNRFRILAGITQKDTLATLHIPSAGETIELKYVPSFFEKLKYKLCGFECDIIRQEPVSNESHITQPVLSDKKRLMHWLLS